MKKKTVLDKDEEKLIADYERDAFRDPLPPIPQGECSLQEAVELRDACDCSPKLD